MAENLVLANLTIDSDGSVRGIAKGVAALRKGETGLDRFGKAQVAAGQATQGFLGRLGSLPAMLTRIASAVGITAAAFAAWRGIQAIIRGVTDALRRGINLAGEYERNAVILRQAIGGTADEMLRYADSLQRATQFTDDQIVPAMAQLANITGATGQELKDLTKLTLDVAVTFNRNLNDSAILVAKSAQGVTDRLNELGFTIDKSITGKAERGAAALELLRSKTVDSEGAAQTFSGTLARLSSVWDTLLRNIGNLIVQSPVTRQLLEGLVEVIGELADKIAAVPIEEFTPQLREMTVSALDTAIAVIKVTASVAKFGIVLNAIRNPLGVDTALLNGMLKAIAEIDAAVPGLERLREKIAAIQDDARGGFALESPAAVVPGAEAAAAVTPFDPFAFGGIASPQAIDEVINKAGEAKVAIEDAFRAGAISDEAFAAASDNIRDKLLSLQLPADQLRTIFSQLGISYDQVVETISDPTPWEQFVERIQSAGQRAALGIDLATTAMNQFGNSLAQAFLGKETNFKKFMAEMLAAMVPVLTGFAAIATVRALLGEANQLATAGYALAAAAAVGAAARALGAGRDSGVSGLGRGGGRRGAPALAGDLGGGRQTVNVFVQGSLLGSDPNELARSISRLINTNQRDGSF